MQIIEPKEPGFLRFLRFLGCLGLVPGARCQGSRVPARRCGRLPGIARELGDPLRPYLEGGADGAAQVVERQLVREALPDQPASFRANTAIEAKLGERVDRRSEERRVGKECRSRGAPDRVK